MTNLTHLTIAEALKGLESKEYTAKELTQAHIDAGTQAENLNAYVTYTPELALTQADESDKRRAAGSAGKLDGIPLAIKDLYCTKGIRTTACSKILDNFVPEYESTVTQNLLNEGAVFLGKVSTDEFAMGSTNASSAHGPVISPWKRNGDNTNLVPGGSSGGSAAAVAGRIALGATGTDTGGSIRMPSAYCGITGIKPTYGRCSRWGIIAYASSFDQAGPIARSVEDCALMLNVMAGYDEKDSTSANQPVPDFTALLGQDLKGKRIGIPKEYRSEGLSPEIADLWDQGAKWLEQAGAEVVEVSLPHTKYALATYYILVPAEASSNLARYDGLRYGVRVDEGGNLNDMYKKSRAAGFGEEVTRRILIGTYVLSAGYYDAYYIKAQKVRRLITQDFQKAFETCDALLTPATPTPAFPIGQDDDDPVTMYLNDIFTVTANLAGIPGMSVPAGLSSDGLPLGLQLLGKPWDEAGLLQIGSTLEAQAKFSAMPELVLKKAA
ncbi:MAG: Asp-tRNA(Asn)/Glu-tRNA(Gln) amidotransferase subunit GatA [Alphaproteobacteria bacterium]|nr:Asp-tRNA(Asn)/Glu-tRNA(Gln) amidotransferase subunit GatA [Alphaproteobacteria bacterium]MCD8526410.1 Asp-tRNA(Asn)/Glu-tRNA(Gln) amidotransferase subunit GatA [Alphaproteobacteria bacterium]